VRTLLESGARLPRVSPGSRCCLPKLRSLESMTWLLSPPPVFFYNSPHVSSPQTLPRNTASSLSIASKSSSRKSGPSSTSRRPQAASSAPKAGFVRQTLLVGSSPMLVRLETGTPRRHPRNRRPLVLEGDLEGQKALRKRFGICFQMVAENPSWAPRIHGELLILGLEISQRTVSRWMKRASSDPDPPSAGSLFCATIGKPSRRSTSSRFRRSLSPCSTASSSSSTIVDEFCTATSQAIRRACGSSR